MLLKKLIASIVGLLLGFGFGVIYFKGCSKPSSDNEDPVITTDQSNIISEDSKKIDSLRLEIERKERIIGHLKDSVKVIETIRTIEVDNVKNLPLDSAVMYLNLKLESYENIY